VLVSAPLYHADIVAVSSDDSGATFHVDELWTLLYRRPLPKSMYRINTTSLVNVTDCAVTVTTVVATRDDPGSFGGGGAARAIEAAFTRTALVEAGDLFGANITAGVATTVVWAFGKEGRGARAILLSCVYVYSICV
jgi:hypothetical protein